jgi:3-oxoacyl-(acyl-carrier-protein) synthase
MLVGGSEAVSRVALACFNRLGAVDPQWCRPFDRGRKGTVMGEGAAVLVLESADHLRQRGGRCYARAEGWGWSCDGHHATIPEPSGRAATLAVTHALADAGLGPDAIDAVLAHGTGTELNDLVESKVLAEALGPRCPTVPVCALKGKLGHSGGAAGAFQCLTACLVLAHGVLPPTGNVPELDPRCPLLLPDRPLTGAFRHILMSSYAFGGNNVSLIVSA